MVSTTRFIYPASHDPIGFCSMWVCYIISRSAPKTHFLDLKYLKYRRFCHCLLQNLLPKYWNRYISLSNQSFFEVGDVGVMNLHKCGEMEPEYWHLNGKTSSGKHALQLCNKIKIRRMGFQSEKEAEVKASKRCHLSCWCSLVVGILNHYTGLQLYPNPILGYPPPHKPWDSLLHRRACHPPVHHPKGHVFSSS